MCTYITQMVMKRKTSSEEGEGTTVPFTCSSSPSCSFVIDSKLLSLLHKFVQLTSSQEPWKITYYHSFMSTKKGGGGRGEGGQGMDGSTASNACLGEKPCIFGWYSI